MGLFPPSRERWEQLVPEYIKALQKENIPLVPGIMVFDVLYGGLYHHPRGIVKTVSEDGSGCGVDYPGGSCGSATSYWCPDTQDVLTAQYVKAWRAGSPPTHVARCSCGAAGRATLIACPFQVKAFQKTRAACCCCEVCEQACDRDVEWTIKVLKRKADP